MADSIVAPGASKGSGATSDHDLTMDAVNRVEDTLDSLLAMLDVGCAVTADGTAILADTSIPTLFHHCYDMVQAAKADTAILFEAYRRIALPAHCGTAFPAGTTDDQVQQ